MIVVTTVYLLFFFSKGVSQLWCWHCIHPECAENPSNTYKSSRVTCQNSQVCQKVIYSRTIENESNTTDTIRNVVRSCSAGDCIEEDTLTHCTEKDRMLGCRLKVCCNDRDYCNRAAKKGLSYLYGLLLCLWLVH